MILCNYSAVLYADLPYGLGLAEWDEKAPTEAELVKLLRGYLYLKPDQRMLSMVMWVNPFELGLVKRVLTELNFKHIQVFGVVQERLQPGV